jgi:hypothetical protein
LIKKRAKSGQKLLFPSISMSKYGNSWVNSPRSARSPKKAPGSPKARRGINIPGNTKSPGEAVSEAPRGKQKGRAAAAGMV